MQSINQEYLTPDERERAAYLAGNYELAEALQKIDELKREINRLEYLLIDNGVDNGKT